MALPCKGMAGLLTCKICELLWHGPLGPVTLIVTDTRTFFNRHAVIDIAIPPGTPFPLETLSYIATAQEIDRARGARGFVQSLIAAAENTAAWREYVARPTKRSSHARQQAPPSRPKPGRRRLKLGAPR